MMTADGTCSHAALMVAATDEDAILSTLLVGNLAASNTCCVIVHCFL